MKALEPITPDPDRLRTELDELRQFLNQHGAMRERADIVPFFMARRQLLAYVGQIHWRNARCDRLATELGLFGDLRCDLAIADSVSHAVLLVEFEDAGPDSIFAHRQGKSLANWSMRFEHGFSQIVDWLWRLDREGGSDAMERLFGSRRPDFQAALIVGRSTGMTVSDNDRFRWRSAHTFINGKPVTCWTFDDLLAFLGGRLSWLPGATV